MLLLSLSLIELKMAAINVVFVQVVLKTDTPAPKMCYRSFTVATRGSSPSTLFCRNTELDRKKSKSEKISKLCITGVTDSCFGQRGVDARAARLALLDYDFSGRCMDFCVLVASLFIRYWRGAGVTFGRLFLCHDQFGSV
ncbi:hypothetical protein BaRGS_00019057 [Batillaria attramentaria]|uniref:Secreted protein n=1 Tax=Batillaria attramentaria TaxID=370345 RepID=A0ABD0KQW5_9CAEN